MKLIIISIVLLLMVQNIFGQVAIIKDSDGWTNVREEPKKDSKVIRKIYEHQVFWFNPNYDKKKDKWIQIYMPKNNFSLEDCEQNLIKGFIHKSRLKPIEEIEKYEGKDLSFNYLLSNFDPSQRNIDKVDGKWISKIDGRRFFGTDGTIPNVEVDKVDVKIEGKQILIHKIFYSDIFECHNSFNIYRIGKIFIIHQWNSDGAGAYEIVWVIDKNGLKQRLVGTIL